MKTGNEGIIEATNAFLENLTREEKRKIYIAFCAIAEAYFMSGAWGLHSEVILNAVMEKYETRVPGITAMVCEFMEVGEIEQENFGLSTPFEKEKKEIERFS